MLQIFNGFSRIHSLNIYGGVEVKTSCVCNRRVVIYVDGPRKALVAGSRHRRVEREIDSVCVCVRERQTEEKDFDR